MRARWRTSWQTTAINWLSLRVEAKSGLMRMVPGVEVCFVEVTAIVGMDVVVLIEVWSKRVEKKGEMRIR